MKKRFTALIMSVLLIMLTFVSCSSAEKTAVNISGAQITAGVYTYFYDHVYDNREKYGIEGEDISAQVKEKTVELLKEYVAVNSMAQKLDISLSYTLKMQTASDTDSRWELFGDYYSQLDMTKQDLNKILTNEAFKSALLEYYYGENSTVSPTSTKKLKEAFADKYIGIKVIAASMTTTDTLGNTVTLGKEELSSLRDVFSDMKDKLSSGDDIDEVYGTYITNLDLVGTQSLETYIITETSVGYGEDFFSKIKALKYNTATVIEYEDTIYLFYRVDISGDDMGYFYTYKNDVLVDMCMSKLEKKISQKAKEYTLLRDRTSVTGKIREAVEKIHADDINNSQ